MLAGGLIAWAAQTPASLSFAIADDSTSVPTVTAQQTAWNHGMVSAEIAWLSNPATFHEQLIAVLAGDCLEIHGAVSNEAARSLAMKLAREASRMTIVDRMETARAPALAAPDRSLNMVYRDSVQALYHECPLLSRALTVSTLDRGEVIVRGEVATLEDKLAISRCLKSVAGCNCVKNQVRTKTGMQAVYNVTAPKQLPQDNSLLARLGIVQPRTEVPGSPSVIVHNYPARDSVQPVSTKPELATVPSAGVSQPPARPALLPEIVSTAAAEHRQEAREAKTSPIVEPILLTSTTAAFDTSKLRHAIAVTCGIDENAIRVVANDAKSLAITMSLPDADTGKNLATKVLAMPELVPYGVTLDVSIVH
jgi:hypothetical protein